MPQFRVKYQDALKHLARINDDVVNYSNYISSHHNRTCNDRNLSESCPTAVNHHFQEIDNLKDLLERMHTDFQEYPEILARDNLDINSLAKACKVYRDIFNHGHTPLGSRLTGFKGEDLPRLTHYFRLFEWVDSVIQVAPSFEANDSYFQDQYEETKELAIKVKSQLLNFLEPLIIALQSTFVNTARRDFAVATRQTVGAYSDLHAALIAQPKLLSEIGFATRAQAEMKRALKPKYIQDQSRIGVDQVFYDIKDAVYNSSGKEARNTVIEILESTAKKSRTFKKDLALAISYQLDDGLTVPQRIIELTQKPQDQEHALGILLALGNFGVEFDGRDEKLNTCLHYLRTWHNNLAKFLTLMRDEVSKTAVNANNQTAKEKVGRRVLDESDPHYRQDDFEMLMSILEAKSVDQRPTQKIK